MSTALSANSVLNENLQRLIVLRWHLLAGGALLLWASGSSGLLTSATAGASLVLLLYGAVNALTWWRRRRELSQVGFLFQLLLDLGFISAFIALTDGAASAFTLLMLLPVLVAAATLRTGPTWVITVLAIFAYSTLIWPGDNPHAGHHDMADDFAAHVIGMWLGFVFLALLVSYFVAGMARRLRQRDQALAGAREKSLRDDRVVALGVMAASTAHELGTPLSSMAVIIGELRQDPNLDSDTRSQLQLLEQQVERCGQSLRALASQNSASQGKRLALADFLQQTISQWQQTRPDVTLVEDWQAQGKGPDILADRGLQQVIKTLLDNAANASKEPVQLSVCRYHPDLLIRISDQGPGIQRGLLARLGRESIHKPKSDSGMGIGLLLAHSFVERLGGSIDYQNATGTGSCITLSLPLAALEITAQ